MTLSYLTADDVKTIHVDDSAPTYGQSVTGYGPKIPTRYRLTLTDGRTRRVYVACYGNSGSAYVVVGGVDRYLSSDVEYDIEAARTQYDAPLMAAWLGPALDDMVYPSFT